MESNEQTITCHFCFETFEIDKTTKPRNYQVIEGRKNTKSSVIRMVTPRTKKKESRV